MAFNSNSGKQAFSATAAQTDFDFNFKIYDGETDIKVYLKFLLLFSIVPKINVIHLIV